MVKEKQPNFVLLVETLSKKKSLERISIRMGFDDLFVVEPIGRSGGLALLWKEERDLEIYNYSR
jgi:hypothetical protein